jgi:nucleoside-diphosphate-sugar epimerase
LNRALVPALISAGHSVVGMTRSPAKIGVVRRLGAEPAFADDLDGEAVSAAVMSARPDVVIHQMTALDAVTDLRL